jgi:hypothetical protein
MVKEYTLSTTNKLFTKPILSIGGKAVVVEKDLIPIEPRELV